jgi:hypothetical protein
MIRDNTIDRFKLNYRFIDFYYIGLIDREILLFQQQYLILRFLSNFSTVHKFLLSMFLLIGDFILNLLF